MLGVTSRADGGLISRGDTGTAGACDGGVGTIIDGLEKGGDPMGCALGATSCSAWGLGRGGANRDRGDLRGVDGDLRGVGGLDTAGVITTVAVTVLFGTATARVLEVTI